METTPFTIRLPIDLKEKLERAAADDNRSVNNMILTILLKWSKENCKD